MRYNKENLMILAYYNFIINLIVILWKFTNS